MDNLKLAFEGAWKVLSVALLFGVGLPALFALGIRALAIGGAGEDGGSVRPIGRLLGALCFALVALLIGIGLLYILAKGFGKVVSFEHIVPTLVDE
jgi:hypothetical protein